MLNSNKNIIIESITAVVLLISLSIFPSISFSAPGTIECDQIDVYDRIKCKSDAVGDQLLYTSDVFNTGKLNQHARPGQLKHINNAKTKAVHEKKITSKERFQKRAKNEAKSRKDTIGQLIVLDDYNGNGICDYEENEECLAVELDEYGDPQACNPYKRNKGKNSGLECDLLYEDVPDDDEFSVAEEMESSLDAIESDLHVMNTQLDIVNDGEPVTTSRDVVYAEASTNDACVFPDQTSGLSDAIV